MANQVSAILLAPQFCIKNARSVLFDSEVMQRVLDMSEKTSSDSDESEVVNRWRTLVLPIMPPSSVSFHAFPHIPQGLRSQVKHVFVYDYRTSQYN